MTAEDIYIDPSALIRLYLRQDGSAELAAWRRRLRGSFPVTHHGRVELANAVGRAVFREEITPEQAAETWSWILDDFAHGRLSQADLLWRAALNRAVELGLLHTPKLGTRSLDVLHVACALELNAKYFLTFDERQQELAAAVGLKLIRL